MIFKFFIKIYLFYIFLLPETPEKTAEQEVQA